MAAAFAGSDGAVAAAGVLVAGVADLVDAGFAAAGGVTAPVFTPGVVFAVAEAFLPGDDLVDADWPAVGADAPPAELWSWRDWQLWPAMASLLPANRHSAQWLLSPAL